ncbi:MAG: helix-turn-helix transcriptional regulator [Hyphomicrobiales bacterium]|nr:helix-turn-helix transcriptional regulator [Hyphomicrobiales bacterium]
MARPSKIVEKELAPLQKRIFQLIGEETQSAFAARAGISQSGLNRILQGGDPGVETLIAIANAGKRSVEWLATGREPAGAPPPETAMISLIDIRPSAGPGTLATDYSIGRIPFSRATLAQIGLRPENARAAYADGTSMEPTIRDGGLIVIDASQRQFVDNRIFFFSIGDDMFVKRVRMTPGAGWQIISDNPEIAPAAFPEGDPVRIYGRVKWTERLL